MNQELASYTQEVLAEASAIIRKTRDPKKDGAFFPLPSECHVACKEALSTISYRHAPKLLGQPKVDEWSEERCRFADELLKTEMGRVSAREGWVQEFWNFTRKSMRMPTEHEAAACKASANRMDTLIEKIEAGKFPGGVAVEVLKGCCKAIRSRRAEKAAKAFGEGEAA